MSDHTRDGRPHLEVVPPPDPGAHEPTPPHDNDAERAVLSAMLRGDRQAIDDITTTLTGRDFYQPRHELIHDAALHLYARGTLPDIPAVTDHLRTTGNLNRAGGTAYLHELHAATIITTNAGYHADTVRALAERRRYATALFNGWRRALDATIDTRVTDLRTAVDQALDEARTTINGLDGEKSGRFLDFTELYTVPQQPIPWLVAPILAAGRVTLLYAPGKAGKSLVAMESACALATGSLALTQTVAHEPMHVLYIDQEQTPEDWRDRTQDMGYTVDDAAALTEHLHVANLQTWSPLDTAAGGAQLLAEVHRTGARAVIVDTVSKVVAGEENSNDTQQALYRHAIAPLKREGIAVLLLDHTGKDLEKGARGGSAKTDNIDIAYQLTKRGQDPRGRDRLTLAPTHVRFRDGATDHTLHLVRATTPRLTHVEDEWTGSTDPADQFRPTRFMEKISRLVEATPGLSKSEVLDLVTGRAEYKRKALATLIAEGYIEDTRGQHNKAVLSELKPYRETTDPLASESPDTEQEDTP